MELRQIQINAATPGYTATDLNAGREIERSRKERGRSSRWPRSTTRPHRNVRQRRGIIALVSAPTAGPDT
jgi:hypothetical protein